VPSTCLDEHSLERPWLQVLAHVAELEAACASLERENALLAHQLSASEQREAHSTTHAQHSAQHSAQHRAQHSASRAGTDAQHDAEADARALRTARERLLEAQQGAASALERTAVAELRCTIAERVAASAEVATRALLLEIRPLEAQLGHERLATSRAAAAAAEAVGRASELQDAHRRAEEISGELEVAKAAAAAADGSARTLAMELTNAREASSALELKMQRLQNEVALEAQARRQAGAASERERSAAQRAALLCLGLSLNEEESHWAAERHARRIESVMSKGETMRAMAEAAEERSKRHELEQTLGARIAQVMAADDD